VAEGHLALERGLRPDLANRPKERRLGQGIESFRLRHGAASIMLGNGMKPLTLVHREDAAHPPRHAVSVDLRITADAIEAAFQVRGSGTHVNPALSREVSQWGLWDWDVVELFVAPGGAANPLPYYEFQVSPLGQYFELEIFSPRKLQNRNFVSGLERSATKTPDGWQAWLKIPRDSLPSSPAPVIGGVFAILGTPGAREYWSLFQSPTEHPDFHLPEQFQMLK
jgi:hypothetical protein